MDVKSSTNMLAPDDKDAGKRRAREAPDSPVMAGQGNRRSSHLEVPDDMKTRNSQGVDDVLKTLSFTLGMGSVNALTYRSYVDPQEARPDIAHYETGSTQKKKATFLELQARDFRLENKMDNVDEEEEDDEVEAAPEEEDTSSKFGTWDGVFVSCLLNIFGVIMFLRLGWVVGQAGIGLAIVIISISTVVTTLTTLSMSAIATNGRVKAGGAYFLISRSIGPRIGGAIGFLFSMGMSVAVALYVIGFTETLVTQLFDTWSLTGDKLWDIRLYGLILTAILFIMAMIGVDWVIKLQLGLMALLTVSIISLLIGTFTSRSEADGMEGYSADLASDNLGPSFTRTDGQDYNFFTTFGVFFPAVTGIMAGANISGDLRNPSEAIPMGTLASVVVSWFVYSIMALMVGAMTRRAVGEEGGLLFDNLIMAKISIWEPLVLAGIYAATFSSALASIVGAPRVLQMLAADGIIPFLDYFAVVRESDGAPVRGYVVCTLVACGCVLIGELNLIAPLITMFFMMTYGLINFACYALEVSKSPGWRPTFTYFNKWSCLFGAVLCLIIMMLTDVLFAVIALCIGFAIYRYVQHKDVYVNWGSAGEAHRDLQGVKTLMSLRRVKDHIKTFRPHYLVMSGPPEERQELVRFMSTLQLGYGAVVFGNIRVGAFEEHASTEEQVSQLRNGYWESEKGADVKMAGFLDTVVADNFRAGALALLQLAGIGRLRPNTIILGYKNNWREDKDGTAQYVDTIKSAFRLHMGVVVCRGMRTIDWKAKDPSGTIDVWWLVDDGGLTVLVAYLLSRQKYWRQNTTDSSVSTVRMFIVVEGGKDIASLYRMVGTLLRHFRMDWDVQIIKAGRKCHDLTIKRFTALHDTQLNAERRPLAIKRWLRVVELIHEHSNKSKLVLCIMPFPRDYTHSGGYMSILEMLSADMPPMVLMRGSGANVLTFESE